MKTRNKPYSARFPNYHSESQHLIKTEKLEILAQEKKSIIQNRLRRNYHRNLELAAAFEGKSIHKSMEFEDDDSSSEIHIKKPEIEDRDTQLWNIIRTMDHTELYKYNSKTVLDQLKSGVKEDQEDALVVLAGAFNTIGNLRFWLQAGKLKMDDFPLELIVQISDSIETKLSSVQTSILMLLNYQTEYKSVEFLTRCFPDCLRYAAKFIKCTVQGSQEPKSMAVVLLEEISSTFSRYETAEQMQEIWNLLNDWDVLLRVMDFSGFQNASDNELAYAARVFDLLETVWKYKPLDEEFIPFLFCSCVELYTLMRSKLLNTKVDKMIEQIFSLFDDFYLGEIVGWHIHQKFKSSEKFDERIPAQVRDSARITEQLFGFLKNNYTCDLLWSIFYKQSKSKENDCHHIYWDAGLTREQVAFCFRQSKSRWMMPIFLDSWREKWLQEQVGLDTLEEVAKELESVLFLRRNEFSKAWMSPLFDFCSRFKTIRLRDPASKGLRGELMTTYEIDYYRLENLRKGTGVFRILPEYYAQCLEKKFTASFVRQQLCGLRIWDPNLQVPIPGFSNEWLMRIASCGKTKKLPQDKFVIYQGSLLYVIIFTGYLNYPPRYILVNRKNGKLLLSSSVSIPSNTSQEKTLKEELTFSKRGHPMLLQKQHENHKEVRLYSLKHTRKANVRSGVPFVSLRFDFNVHRGEKFTVYKDYIACLFERYLYIFKQEANLSDCYMMQEDPLGSPAPPENIVYHSVDSLKQPRSINYSRVLVHTWVEHGYPQQLEFTSTHLCYLSSSGKLVCLPLLVGLPALQIANIGISQDFSLTPAGTSLTVAKASKGMCFDVFQMGRVAKNFLATPIKVATPAPKLLQSHMQEEPLPDQDENLPQINKNLLTHFSN